MTSYKVLAMVLVLVFGLMLFLPTFVSAESLIIQMVKLFGIAYVVNQYGGQINDFINNLLNQHGIKYAGATKVVPIISIGQGGYIGAAQVQGPPGQVSTVKAVGQLETKLLGLRGKLLIPVSTENPTSSVTRVKGVGVSALVDLKI
jgi:hypothetical protein